MHADTLQLLTTRFIFDKEGESPEWSSSLPTCAYVSHGMQHSPLSFDLYSTSRTGNQHVVLFHVSLWTSCKQREQRHGTDSSTRTGLT